MRKSIVFVLVASFLFVSCKKEKLNTPKLPGWDSTSTLKSYPSYAHLKPGNYWIYQIFELDTFGNATPTDQYDSVYAGPEKEFNGKMYQSRMIPDFGGTTDYRAEYITDSLHYLVSSNGLILFSSENFKTIFYSKHFVWSVDDTLALVQHKMNEKGRSVTVPAGTFVTSAFTQVWNMYPDHRNGGKIIELKTKYNKDIGIISETLLYNLSNAYIRTERRLVRYSVK